MTMSRESCTVVSPDDDVRRAGPRSTSLVRSGRWPATTDMDSRFKDSRFCFPQGFALPLKHLESIIYLSHSHT